MRADEARIGAADVAEVERRLIERFSDRLPEAMIRVVVREVAATFEHATITTFIPLLVERYSREQLLRLAATPPASLQEAS